MTALQLLAELMKCLAVSLEVEPPKCRVSRGALVVETLLFSCWLFEGILYVPACRRLWFSLPPCGPSPSAILTVLLCKEWSLVWARASMASVHQTQPAALTVSQLWLSHVRLMLSSAVARHDPNIPKSILQHLWFSLSYGCRT